MRPASPVARPMSPMVTSIPVENRSARRNARFVLMRPCSSMNPTMSGMLARWHGESTMESTPQTKAAMRAMPAELESATESQEKSSSSISAPPSLRALSQPRPGGKIPRAGNTRCHVYRETPGWEWRGCGTSWRPACLPGSIRGGTPRARGRRTSPQPPS